MFQIEGDKVKYRNVTPTGLKKLLLLTAYQIIAPDGAA